MNRDYVDAHFESLRRIEKELKGSLEADMNEDTTRLRIIDRFLFEALDWEHDNVETESYCRMEGYADYVCSVESTTTLVIEAKRRGTYFLLGDHEYEDRPYSFGFIARESKAASEALQQAIGYAVTLGSRYVAVSNGNQWLFTLAYVEGKSLDERLVYVFESLEAVLNKFRTFCNCFLKNQLAKHEIDFSLLDSRSKPAPPRIALQIPGFPVSADRNMYQNELSYVLNYVWNIMEHNDGAEDFVRECYVNPDNHRDAISLARDLLAKRTTEDAIIQGNDIQTTDDVPKAIDQMPSEKPFVILGQIGRGKTSFLKYLRHVAASDLLERFIQIDIDFLDKPSSSKEITEFIYTEIEGQMLSNYDIDINEDRFVRGVLHLDLERLKRTPKGKIFDHSSLEYVRFELDEIEKIQNSRHNYLTKVFQHIKRGRRTSIAIFVDNLDRRELDIQEQAFLKASSMARDWASSVFICLRPETFFKSREAGVLDTIAPTTFTVSHPDLSLVLKRRFAYAKSISDGKKLKSSLEGGYDPSIKTKLPSVSLILESCEFAARRRNGIIPLLEALSNGNIRRLLEFARKVLCSGHLDTRKILEIICTEGNYVVPDYEGIKALLYGEYMQYYAVESPFINVFDAMNDNKVEHFAILSILGYLSRVGSTPLTTYTSMRDVVAYANGIGYSVSDIVSRTEALVEKQLVDVMPNTVSHTAVDKKIRITSLGLFHLHNLPSIFQYLDAMTIDTPIMDIDVRRLIFDTVRIRERLNRTSAFIDYLDDCSKLVRCQFVREQWDRLSADAKDGISEIEDRIN